MKNYYKIGLVLAAALGCWTITRAQSKDVITLRLAAPGPDTETTDTIVDLGVKSERQWRSTGAPYRLSGNELTHMFTGNLLNTLPGRIPGLTVVTVSGEPGYDAPTLYVRGQTSWNIAGNALIILLDGFQVDLNALSALSPYEIESVTLLKDAAATAMFGLQGGAGVLSI